MEKLISNSQSNLQEPMTCRKNEHYNQQFQFFKFTENLEEMLQCFSCINEDPQLNKKISIDQILNFPVSKIQNFPPLQDQSKDKQVRQIMEDFTQDKIKQFKEYIKKQIEQHYEQKIQILNQSKKDVIIQFEQIMEFTDVSQYYNIDQLKAAINQYKNKQINLEELFQEQLKMKKDFECEKKCQVMLWNQQKQQEITNQLNNLKQKLNQKFLAFTNNEITINTQELHNIQRNIDQAFQNSFNQYQQHQQLQYLVNQQLYQNQQLQFLKIQQQQQQQQLQQHQKQPLQQQIKFHKSSYNNDIKDEIRIINNHNNNIEIRIQNKTYYTKQIYSDVLNKNTTYHFKMIFHFFQQSKDVNFYLIDPQVKDSSWINQIQINQNDASRFSYQGKRQSPIIQIHKALDLCRDERTVWNFVFNKNRNSFQIYDDQRCACVQGSIQNDSNLNMVDQFMLGIEFSQQCNQPIIFEILDIKVY